MPFSPSWCLRFRSASCWDGSLLFSLGWEATSIYSPIRLMNHWIMVQFGYWFRFCPVPSQYLLSEICRLLTIRLLVQFLVSRNMEPLSGFDCTSVCTTASFLLLALHPIPELPWDSQTTCNKTVEPCNIFTQWRHLWTLWVACNCWRSLTSLYILM